jgi:hypothetical protein
LVIVHLYTIHEIDCSNNNKMQIQESFLTVLPGLLPPRGEQLFGAALLLPRQKKGRPESRPS